jgi:NNP family nitrate/nitrite transporter-like MFS transporter
VPLRWPTTTAVAGSMIGEIGALGGGLVPMLMGQAKQRTDSFLTGFVVLAVFSLLMLGVMRTMQVRWTRTWAEGRYQSPAAGRIHPQRPSVAGPAGK